MLVFKTVEAPRFLKGWTFCAVNSFLIIIFTYAVVRPLARREERKFGRDDVSSEIEIEDPGSEKNSGKDPRDVVIPA